MAKGYKIDAASARALGKLLEAGSSIKPGMSPKNFSDTSYSRVRLAQAPVGGIPARVGLVPGSAECKKVNIIDGDLVITDQEFAVLNWDLVVRGADDDRIILVSKHSDNALLIAPIGNGDSGVEPCGESGITIPDIETQPIVSAADLDYVIGLKDGCLVLVEVRNCPPSEEPSGSVLPSGSVISSVLPSGSLISI